MASLPETLDGPTRQHHARRAVSDVKRHLQKSALKLVAYVVAAYAVLRRRVGPIIKAAHSP